MNVTFQQTFEWQSNCFTNTCNSITRHVSRDAMGRSSSFSREWIPCGGWVWNGWEFMKNKFETIYSSLRLCRVKMWIETVSPIILTWVPVLSRSLIIQWSWTCNRLDTRDSRAAGALAFKFTIKRSNEITIVKHPCSALIAQRPMKENFSCLRGTAAWWDNKSLYW